MFLTSEKQEYYMGIAFAVRKLANCVGRKVGALLVVENRIISTGYNGTPEGLTNCNDGGCHRCANREAYQSSVGYDVCICAHNVRTLYYLEEWVYPREELQAQYGDLLRRFNVVNVAMRDPDAAWAHGGVSTQPSGDDLGHQQL